MVCLAPLFLYLFMKIEDVTRFKKKALYWANQQSSIICYLDNNEHTHNPYSNYECLLAVGSVATLERDTADSYWDSLSAFAAMYANEWLFGYFGYDLKNELENLTSTNADRLDFAPLSFFVPQHLIRIDLQGQLQIDSKTSTPQAILQAIEQTSIPTPPLLPPITIQPTISKVEYLDTLHKIKQHIIDGDLYEMNFCQEFSATADLEPLPLFDHLNQFSKAPFAAYWQMNEQHILCASPERFVCKQDQKIISQPIKGTRPRGADASTDQALKKDLATSIKDQAENVMIVDLVRNDLTKSCQTGTIKVEELFGIYGFESVFQMISTIVGTVQSNLSWVEVIKNAFPMGSMTGAPKVMSMQLIEQYEQSKRGVYSGAIGYITPEQDFDFNVVIRSILYQQATQQLSFQVGGAIVYDSDPIEEYEECLLKAKGMFAVLQGL